MIDPGDDAGSRWPQLTGQAISDYLGFSPRWLAKLEEQKFVERLPNRLFDAGHVCKGYIAFLKDEARRSSKTEMARRKDEAHAVKLEIANRVALNELIDIEEVETFFVESHTILATQIRALPAAITRDLELRAKIEQYVNAAIERIERSFREAAADWSGGRTPSAISDDGDAD